MTQHQQGGSRHENLESTLVGPRPRAALLHLHAPTEFLRLRRLGGDVVTDTGEDVAEYQLPALAADPLVSVHYDLDEETELGDCWECHKHPPSNYLTGGTPLPRGVWRIAYTRGGQDGYLDVCGRWCSDWALAGLLSDPIYPARKIVLHVPTKWAPPGPRRAMRGRRWNPIRRT